MGKKEMLVNQIGDISSSDLLHSKVIIFNNTVLSVYNYYVSIKNKKIHTFYKWKNTCEAFFFLFALEILGPRFQIANVSKALCFLMDYISIYFFH